MNLKNTNQPKLNQNCFNGLTLVPLPLLQHTCFSTAGQEHSISDLVYGKFRLCNDSIFRMLYSEVIQVDLNYKNYS